MSYFETRGGGGGRGKGRLWLGGFILILVGNLGTSTNLDIKPYLVLVWRA
jgi:hypothetical protein